MHARKFFEKIFSLPMPRRILSPSTSKKKIRVLVLASIYPSKAQPVHGLFVKHRMLEVAKLCEIKIVSPIPYLPMVQFLERYRFRNHVPRKEIHDGVDVFYPRYLSIPLILKPLDSIFMFFSLIFFIRKIKRDFDFDIIDAHFGYPDGFAAVLAGFFFKKPVIITLRGHDIFELPRHPVRIRQVRYALKKANIIFSVAEALKEGAVKLGIPPQKIHVISNGVNIKRFSPLEKRKAREIVGLPANKKIVFSVGHLVIRKGFQFIIDAIEKLNDKNIMLVICGGSSQEGNFEGELKLRASKAGVDVFFAGALKNEDLSLWYNACDIFCLASSKEGWPNVVLEAMACGKPVVATRVWGTPEVICNEKLGILVEKQDGKLLADAIETALKKEWDEEYIRNYACSQTWAHVAQKVYKDFLKVVDPNH